MDQYKLSIFNAANDVIRRIHSPAPGEAVNLANGSADLGALIWAINTGFNAVSQLEDAMRVIEVYADKAFWQTAPEKTDAAADMGQQARIFIDRMLDA